MLASPAELLGLAPDELGRLVAAMTPAELAELDAILSRYLWLPLPGPQTEAFYSPADELFYGGAAGGGKMLALDTPLPTPDGWRTVGETRVGDWLFDEAGQPCRVLGLSAIERPPAYRVTFDDGAAIDACAEHRWLTFDARELSALTRRTPEWRAARRAKRPSRAGETKSERFRAATGARNRACAQTREAPRGSIRTTAQIAATLTLASGRHNHAVPVCGPLELPECALPLDPYLLGVWLGDGTAARAEITTADREIVAAFDAAGFRTKPRARYAHGVFGLLPVLRALGVLDHKHVPAAYLRASRAQRLALLQGLMDTDGTVARTGGAVEFTSTSRGLAEAVAELALSLGHKLRLREDVARLNGRIVGPNWRIKWRPSEPVFRLARKRARQRFAGRRTTAFRYVVACDPIPPVPMRCLHVSAPSGLFLASRHMVPTHNSDLLLGIAITQHRRSAIFRREYAQLSWFIDRSTELLVTAAKFNGASPPRWTFPDGRRIEFAGCQQPKDVRKFMGRPHDFRGFDELSEIQEKQFRFLVGWVRTTVVGQRTRVVGAGNPPLTAEGEWVNKYWGPWLDDRHPNPAEPGKLRWFIQDGDADREVESPEPVRLRGETVTPKSRTFIKASLADNPFLERTGYRAQLQALPEPLRSMLLDGRFDVAKTDQAMQVIPTAWILAAEARWEELQRQGYTPGPLDALGVDVAWGGADQTVIAPRHGTWFAPYLAVPGAKTPTGDHTATLVMHKLAGRRAAVNIDVIGTGGGAAFSVLRANQVRAYAMIGSLGCKRRDRTDSFGFANMRSAWYWGLREALDPTKGDNLALPPDREARADLAAPTFKLTAKGVQVESKDKIRERLGRSPDKGDAVVYAHATDGLASLAGVQFGDDLGRESPWRGRA